MQYRARLTLKTAQKLRVIAVFILEYLDRNDFTGAEIDSAINMRHAAGADEVNDAIAMSYDGALRNHATSPSSSRMRIRVMLSVPPLSSAS